MRLYTAAQMRAADRYAIETLNVPSTLLMERAARAVAGAAAELAENRRALVLCGPGNNGGDGVACARFLMGFGFSVRTVLVGERGAMSADTQEMARRLEAAGGRIEPFAAEQLGRGYGVVVDALFGTGLRRPLTGPFAAAVAWINAQSAPVVSADVPSGVSSDTGEILGCAVQAARTVTMSAVKRGMLVEPGCVQCGEIHIADIGVEMGESHCHGVDTAMARAMLPKRRPLSHKGDYGKVLILGGSVGYTGAPVLAARAALRSGAGLVTLCVPQSVYPVAAAKLDEAMVYPLPDGEPVSAALEKLAGADVCLLGPGLGRSREAAGLVEAVLTHADVPVILDADGINALAGNINLLDRARCPVALTPHEGEFRRIGGSLEGGRLAAAESFSRAHRCAVVLKGHRTVTAVGGSLYVNTTGGPGLARGGSGDVLAGIVAALAGQTALEAALPLGVWLHGRAGDLCAARMSEYAMLPTDVVGALGSAFLELGED